MFTQKDPNEKTGLEKAIDDLLSEMANFSGDDDEYAKMVTQLDTLYKLKKIDHDERDFALKVEELRIKAQEADSQSKETNHKIESSKRVSAETWAIIGTNLTGILLIVGAERTSVMTSKALSFLFKPK